MSRSSSSHKGAGYEMWSRRPMSGCSPSKENKVICHGIERARSKQELVKMDLEQQQNLSSLTYEATERFNEEVKRHKEAMRSISHLYEDVVRDAFELSPGDFVSFKMSRAGCSSNLVLGVGLVDFEPDSIDVIDGNWGKVGDRPARFSVRVLLLRVRDFEVSKGTVAWVDVVQDKLQKITQAEFEARVAQLKAAKECGKTGSVK